MTQATFVAMEALVQRWIADAKIERIPANSGNASYHEFLKWCLSDKEPFDARPCQSLWGILCYRAGVIDVPAPKERSDRARGSKRAKDNDAAPIGADVQHGGETP